MSSFGRELLKPARRTERLEIALAPGEFTETQIPIGPMFSLSNKLKYKVRASCELLQSNEITL